MFGDRLGLSRKRAGLTQSKLADAMGDRYDRTMISHVETGRAGLVVDGIAKAAQALNVSTDYLLGLSEDPTPAALLSLAARESRSVEWSLPGDEGPLDFVQVPKVATVLGSGMQFYDRSVIELVPFRRDWLLRNRIDPEFCNVVEVLGNEMDPPMRDGSTALLNLRVGLKDLRKGQIYVLETDKGLVARRAQQRKSSDDWVFLDEEASRDWSPEDGSNEDPLTLTNVTRIIGEVKWVLLAL